MIPREALAELAALYEEYQCTEDPLSPRVKQAKFLFDAECRCLYAEESATFRNQMNLEKYVAACVVIEINNFMSHRQTPFPTIQPESKPQE